MRGFGTSRRRTYRGISVYIKPGARKHNPDNTKVAGEIYFGTYRKWVPQADTVQGMMFKARRLIDRELDRAEDIEVRWFRTPLI